MSKIKAKFVCQSCGSVTPRWSGRCDNCGEWNSIAEEMSGGGVGAGPKSAVSSGRPAALTSLDGTIADAQRTISGIGELDRVAGGGFVAGSAVLVGGDPGIGKSTLLLQAAAQMARTGKRVIYVSGEEAIAQVQMRAQRLGLADAPVHLASETHVETILATLEHGPSPDLVVIDSIQTLWTDRVESAPGTVTQVRTGAQALTRFAKRSGAAVVLVGHVTKDGQIAGPRVVEHMVDAVLYFEGDTSHAFRILRGVKNRYGATDEIGVFEMTEMGLQEVANPSALFLDQRDNRARVEKLARGRRVLNVFSYNGGFSLAAARGGATEVTSIDQSGPALESSERNFALNAEVPTIAAARHLTIEGDAFQALTELVKQGERYELVIIDPPAFAVRRSQVREALKAYGRLARLGVGLLAPGGDIVLASCSNPVST